jgi:hypothetical protein
MSPLNSAVYSDRTCLCLAGTEFELEFRYYPIESDSVEHLDSCLRVSFRYNENHASI